MLKLETKFRGGGGRWRLKRFRRAFMLTAHGVRGKLKNDP